MVITTNCKMCMLNDKIQDLIGNPGKRVLEPAVKRAPKDVKVCEKIREAQNNKVLRGKYFKHGKRLPKQGSTTGTAEQNHKIKVCLPSAMFEVTVSLYFQSVSVENKTNNGNAKMTKPHKFVKVQVMGTHKLSYFCSWKRFKNYPVFLRNDIWAQWFKLD